MNLWLHICILIYSLAWTSYLNLVFSCSDLSIIFYILHTNHLKLFVEKAGKMNGKYAYND
jgi:hypothetical protein